LPSTLRTKRRANSGKTGGIGLTRINGNDGIRKKKKKAKFFLFILLFKNQKKRRRENGELTEKIMMMTMLNAFIVCSLFIEE
jgi:hypothetical protein